MKTPARQLAAFLARFDKPVAMVARGALARLRRRLPGAAELVYDNYNALAIGFAPGQKTSEAIFSIAVYPRWVSFFFLQGRGLPDPGRRLKGNGNKVRHVVLTKASDLEDPQIEALIQAALERAATPIDARGKRVLVVKSVSAKQRPRRPG